MAYKHTGGIALCTTLQSASCCKAIRPSVRLKTPASSTCCHGSHTTHLNHRFLHPPVRACQHSTAAAGPPRPRVQGPGPRAPLPRPQATPRTQPLRREGPRRPPRAPGRHVLPQGSRGGSARLPRLRSPRASCRKLLLHKQRRQGLGSRGGCRMLVLLVVVLLPGLRGCVGGQVGAPGGST